MPGLASAATEMSGQDRELRRLWAKYLALAADTAAVRSKIEPARAAYDAEEPPCPEGVLPGTHYENHRWLWRKHGLDELFAKLNSVDRAARETIAEILNTKAEGLFGIAVKLSAQSTDRLSHAKEDYAESVAVALEDIDRLLGSDEFSARFHEAYDVPDHNRTYEHIEDDEDELS
jgi:hypothetical protein